jgi:penicillin-binding protein 1A
VPFVAPNGIRWVRIDRETGKRVYGTFPMQEDPKSSVIWEAFQPQTEPRRSYRGAQGDPYGEQNGEPGDASGQPQSGERAPAATRRARPAVTAVNSNNLQTQNGVY